MRAVINTTARAITGATYPGVEGEDIVFDAVAQKDCEPCYV